MKFKTILWIITLLVAVAGVAAFVVSRKKIMFSDDDDFDINDYDDDDFEDYLNFEDDFDEEVDLDKVSESDLSDDEVENLGKDLLGKFGDESDGDKK
jgi:hypothetical protein